MTAIASTVPASPASADDNALILPGGEASVILGPNAVLRVDGRLRSFRNCTSPGINDFVYPATDVYVVESTFDPLTSPELFPVLEDVTGTPSTIVQGGSAFAEQIIAITGPSGTLGPGNYSVVYDTCQDGRYQRTQGDQVFPNVIKVVYPPVIPPEDPAIAALKSNASTDFGRWQEIGKLFDTLVAVDSLANCAHGSVDNCLGVLAIWVDSPSVQKWIGTYGKVKSATECVTGNAGACFGILSDYWGFSQTPIRDSVVGGAKSLIANQAKAFFGIAADPPRADFATPTSATLDFPVPMVQGAGPVIDSIATFATALEREQMLWTSFLAAIERYQGARAAGDPAAAVAQARSAAGIATTLADASPVTADLLDAVFDTTLAEIPDFDGLSQAFHGEAFRWYTTGFTPDEDRRLRNAGIAGSERSTLPDERRTTSGAQGIE
jgi:hypothetical protein